VPTGWETEALAELERELAQHVGPVARVLVRRAARGLTSLDAVRQAVAPSIADFEARERFLARVGAPRIDTAPSGAGSGSRPTKRDGDPASGVPMRDGDVDKAAAALLSSLGPVARVVARRCAANAQTREQFVARVLEQLTPAIDAHRVQADLWRALG
jgi:serine/threonine-protein kinase